MGQMFTFQGVGQAQISDRRPKLKDGFVGVVEVTRTEVKRTRNAGDKMFVEFTVVESNNQQVHPVGQGYSWGQSLLDQNVANGSLKRFLAAVAGIQTDDKDKMLMLEQHMDNILNTAIQYPDVAGTNQLVGRKVRVETQATRTGNNRDFMIHNWYPVV
jgi:hypothetical protein